MNRTQGELFKKLLLHLILVSLDFTSWMFSTCDAVCIEWCRPRMHCAVGMHTWQGESHHRINTLTFENVVTNSHNPHIV